MSVFNDQEIAYLQSQRLGRIATAGPDGQPHVVPVAFRYNSTTDTVDIGGHGFKTRKKYQPRQVLRHLGRGARTRARPNDRNARRAQQAADLFRRARHARIQRKVQSWMSQ